MAIDASIAQGATGPNMLQTMAGVMQLKGAQLQQNALTQQMNSNKAISTAYQQATDPATGQVDQNKLLGLISQDPAAAYNMPQVQSQIAEQKNKEMEYNKNAFELAVKRTDKLKNGLGSLLNKPDLASGDIMSLIASGVKDGTATAEQAVRYLQNMPQDPTKLKDWVQQNYIQSLSDDAQLKAMLPQTQVLNNGGSQQIVAIDPMTGQPRVTGQIQNTMDPNTASAPTAVFNQQTGQMENVTRQQFQSMAQPQQGGQMGMPPGGMPQGMPPQGGGNGRYPGQQQMPGAPMQQPGAMGVPTGPALGASAAADTAARGSAEGSLALQQQAEQSPQRVYFLQDMMHNLQNFESGPNADWAAKAKALALQVAPGMAAKIGIDPQSVASKEEFSKFATNLAINTSAGLGAGTDSKLAAAVAGNPNASLSSLGNEQIMKVLIGTERATQAKNAAWQNSGEAPQNYGKWSAGWNKEIDPRVFVAPELTQEERAKMYGKLNETEKASFSKSYNAAVRAGIIQRPGG